MKVRKEIKIYIIAVIIVLASSPLIHWVIQNQINTQTKGPTFYGNREINKDYIRFWTDIQPNSWSGMETNQKWSFATTITLKTQVTVTSLGSPTFYTEIILVNQGEIDEGFGFQLTANSTDSVRIKGWSWTEEDESFSEYTDKPINVLMNLEAKKTSTGQIDFYVDSVLIGSISNVIPSQEGVINFDVTNGAQGGFAEVSINYEIQEGT